MQLFSDSTRTDTGPASHGEDSFSYYNRSARLGVVNIRRLLQAWFDAYPDIDKAELAARFRVDFNSAFFELFLHQLGVSLGYNVTVHPSLPGSSKRPDFQLMSLSGPEYLEARVARDESTTVSKEKKILGDLYDQINSLTIPDYFIHLKGVKISNDKQPATRRLKHELQQWVDSLDYEEVSSLASQSLDLVPRWHFDDGALSVLLEVFPVSAPHRGNPDHKPIGVYPIETRWGGSERALRKALQRKSGKYGELRAPFIVAVNSLSFFNPDRITEMEALFGNEQFVMGPDDTEADMLRRPDGFWMGPKGPQNTRVSAVLFCEVHPANVHKAHVCLYHNPWAAHPLSGPLVTLPQATPVNQKMTWSDGRPLGDVFGLAPDWLGE